MIELFEERGNREWMVEAACLGLDPNLFFPERGEDSSQAKAICQSCVVIEECADYAQVNRLTKGIWGGTSERQRRQIREGH